MNYYIQGDAANSDKIKAAFEKLGYEPYCWTFETEFYFTVDCTKTVQIVSSSSKLINIIKTHPDYKELELPIEPKFKAEDRIVSKSDKSTIYRIITLHEERREYIVEIEHKDYHESCPWIAFEDQDDYELAPKPHYDITNFKPKQWVLVRQGDGCAWRLDIFSNLKEGTVCQFECVGNSMVQCIPFDGNEHLLGTTDMCDEQYINW